MTTTETETETRFSIGQMPDRLAKTVAVRLRELLDKIDNHGADPVAAAAQAEQLLKDVQTEVRSHVLSWSKVTAHAHAKRYHGFAGYKAKSTIREIAVGLALIAVGKRGYVDIADLRMQIDERASTVRLREHYVTHAGQALRYWAGLDVEMVYPGARSESPDNVEQVLKYYGMAYLRFRGEPAGDLWPEEREAQGLEDALRRVGNIALQHLLYPDHGSMNMMVQIRLGALMGTFYSDMASRTVVKMCHGALDYGRDVVIPITHDEPRDFLPMYWDTEARKAFDGLQP